MRRILSVIVIAFIAFTSCTKEKTMTAGRPMTAEFGSDKPSYESFKVIFYDLRNNEELEMNVDSADVVLVATDGVVGTQTAAEWIETKCSEWSHSVFYSAGGFVGSSSESDTYFERMELASGPCLVAELGGRSVFVGDVQEEDKEVFVSLTTLGDIHASWIALLPHAADFLKDYAFTDCLAAQNGKPDEGGEVRDIYICISGSVESDVSYRR